MEKKLLSYVAGNLEDWRQLTAFESLKDFRVEVHAISSPELLNHYKSNIKLFIYENVQDMPGYMRGLETRLQHSDIVLSKEISSLSSFQATRIAQKYQIPHLVLVTEHRPNFYRKFSNIVAIQEDILKSCTGFLSVSKKSNSLLDFYSVPESRKKLINLSHSTPVPADIVARQSRFRERAGISSDHVVVGVFSNLVDSFKGEALLGAVKLFKAKNPYDAEKLKVIIIGNGDRAKKFKYLAYEMGIADNVLFLHEDIQLFYWDLLSSLDIVVHPEVISEQLEFHEQYPRFLLDAVAAQCITMVPSGSVAKEMLGDNCYLVSDESEHGYSSCLQKYFDNRELSELKVKQFANSVQSLYSPAASRAVLNEVLKQTIEESEHQSTAVSFKKACEEIQVQLSKYDFANALVLIEQSLLKWDKNSQNTSVLLRLKGDVLAAVNRGDESVEAYAVALDHDGRNWEAYVALGRTSFHGQAYTDAIAFFKKAIGISSESVDAKIGLGMSYFRNSMHNEAMYWLTKAATQQGGEGKALTALIQAASDSPSEEVAVSALEGALENLGESSRLLMALGRLYMKVGFSDKGHHMVQKALSLDHESDAS